ncbi:tRNA glutamyl-Q(34) synthetase GluQRS [Lampropedia puyangensis]|uniref:Glutamyl-Q tRNA(Asp) synthetase n=1 Tax=Lampropedia puyangensis TaxID=1330072 RepID=A0A4S8EL85_9BURK|nr:tRNA glutamyl-Q(34) synthetase GluQRS [Lampropedia puyangensis]THT95389.1 tRNA glutamyl-Q(34) synthetase GluQRS [Lampropedia puyangensis]
MDFSEALKQHQREGLAVARYVGRFAPSPTGPLHVGSVVAALASWLDARAAAAQGVASTWLVRIEDVDAQRCSLAWAHTVLKQLDALGLQADGAVQWQSGRSALYAQALQYLQQTQRTYACRCTRKEIEQAWALRGVQRQRFQTLIYPGTCRHEAYVEPVRAWRFDVQGNEGAPRALSSHAVAWSDRRLGPQMQDVVADVGDYVLQRADGMWSYQLACVVDDALQGITHVVRGEDLTDNTARQLLLQEALGAAHPQYLHVPLALDARGEKLSKGNHAPSIDEVSVQHSLLAAAQVLGLPTQVGDEGALVADLLQRWVAAWAALYPLRWV